MEQENIEVNFPIQEFANEILAKILFFLPYTDKKKARQVCQRWRKIVDNDLYGILLFEANITNHRGPELLNFLLKSSITFEDVIFNRLCSKIQPILEKSGNKIPKIRNITIGKENLTENIRILFEYMCSSEGTESLRILEGSFGDNLIRSALDVEFILKDLMWNNLRQLVLSVDFHMHPIKFKTRSSKHCEAVRKFLRNITIPNLKTFVLYSYSVNGADHHFDTVATLFIIDVHRFLNEHALTLKKLKFKVKFGPGNQVGVNLPEDYFFALTRLRNCSHEYKLNLDSLTLNIFDLHFLENNVPGLLKLDTLSTLTWTPFYWKTYPSEGPYWDPNCPPNPRLIIQLRTLIENNQNTLEVVNISLKPGDSQIFKMMWLKNCSALRKLTIKGFHDSAVEECIDIKIPTLAHFEIWPMYGLSDLVDISEWIVRSLMNIRTFVIVYNTVTPFAMIRLWTIPTIERLTTLKKLTSIRYSSYQNSGPEMILLDNEVELFCQNNERLRFSARNRSYSNRELLERCIQIT